MATQQIKDILDTRIPSPSIVLSPSRATPISTQFSFTRSAEAYGIPATNKGEKFSDGEAVIDGPNNSLLIHIGGTNKFGSPLDQTTNVGENGVTTDNTVYKNKLGATATQINENTNQEKHNIIPDFSELPTDQSGAVTAFVSPGSRRAFRISLRGFDGADRISAAFHMPQDGEPSTYSENSGNSTIRDAFITEWIPGIYWVGIWGVPASGGYFAHPRIGPTPEPGESGAGSVFYTGEGKDVIVHQAQYKSGVTIASPLYEAGTTVNSPTVRLEDLSNHNPDEGTYYMSFTHVGFINRQDNLSDRYKFLSYNKYGPRIKYDPSSENVIAKGGYFLKLGAKGRFKKNKVAFSYNRGSGELVVNGGDNLGSGGGNFSQTPGYLHFSSGLEYRLHDFRYYPQELSAEQKQILTSQ